MPGVQATRAWSTPSRQLYGPLLGRTLNPMTEIVVTVGATEGIFATIQALVDPGDEVILIEPFYDSYPAAVVMAGGIPVYVPLRAPATPPALRHGRLDPPNWPRPSARAPSC